MTEEKKVKIPYRGSGWTIESMANDRNVVLERLTMAGGRLSLPAILSEFEEARDGQFVIWSLLRSRHARLEADKQTVRVEVAGD